MIALEVHRDFVGAEKKVDLILQAHDHNYQRSKQLAHNPSTCPSVPINAYDPDCVVDDGVDGAYPKGAGTVTVIDGTFGRGLDAINPSDPEAPLRQDGLDDMGLHEVHGDARSDRCPIREFDRVVHGRVLDRFRRNAGSGQLSADRAVRPHGDAEQRNEDRSSRGRRARTTRAWIITPSSEAALIWRRRARPPTWTPR